MLEGQAVQLFAYSPFQTKQGRLVLPSSLPFTTQFDITIQCDIKRGFLCFVWGSSLEQVKGISIQDRVIVSNNKPLASPITAVVLNLQDKYD